MKIVLISNNFPPVVDGVGDYTYHLSKNFAERGYQVYIICTRKKEIVEYWQENPEDIHVVPLVDNWSFRCIPVILSQIKNINPDWVAFQYVPYAFNYYGIPFSIASLFALLKLNKYKTLITFHEIAIRIDLNKPKYIIVAIMQRLIAFFISLISNKIITSIELYMNMLGYCSNKTFRIPIGSNILPVKMDASAIHALKSQIAPNNEFIVCSFGSNLRKNDLLLDIVAELTNSLYNVKLILIGKLPGWAVEGIREKAVQLDVLSKIIIPGYLKAEDVFLHLKSSDLFIQLEEITGKNQGGVSIKSGAIAAAYAAGLPIIGTQGDMTDNFFKDGENIVLVEPYDKEGIKNNIIRFINNESDLLKIKQGALYTYDTCLQWPVLVNQYERALVTVTQ